MSAPSRTFLIVVLLCIAPGCATVIRGKTQAVKFETEPANAIVVIDGEKYTAPTVVTLTRRNTHEVTVSAPGYRTISFKFDAQWDALSLAGLPLPGGSVMIAYDAVTGADKSFDDLATIILKKCDGADEAPAELRNFRGKLMNKDEYEHAWEQARWDPDPG